MSQNNTVTWITLDARHHHDGGSWWCNECLNYYQELENQKDFTAEWIEALCAWSTQLAEKAIVLTTALATGFAYMIVGVLWILHCFFEGVDNDTRMHQLELHARDGLGTDERTVRQGQHKSLLAKREALLVKIDKIKDARAFPNSGGKCGITASDSALAKAYEELDVCHDKLASLERQLKYHQHG